MWKEETAWGDQVARSDGGSGGAARKKAINPQEGAPLALTCLFLEERVCERAGQRALDLGYIVSPALLTMATLEG